MAIQMRRGNKADFDPSKMLPGEWAVAIDSDTQNQIVWMCFRAGVIKRMGTYEDFKEQIREATAEIKNEYKEEFQTILGEIEKLAEQTSENRNTVVQIRDDTVNTYLPKMLEYVKKAESSAEKAEASQQQTADSATKAQSYAVGGTGSREGEDFDNAKYYYQQAKDISEGLKGGLQPHGTVAFADLPALADVSTGWMFNISDEFTTTDDFKEGAGNVIPAGANIYKTSDEKWDVLAGTPVTGIKGVNEDSFRRGNVELTAENVGAVATGGDTAENTATFTSSDVADGSSSAWTNVSKLSSGEKHSSIFAKVSQMFKNVRYLYKMLGTTDISKIGNGTCTGAISSLNSSLKKYYTQTEVDNIIKKNKVKSIVIEFEGVTTNESKAFFPKYTYWGYVGGKTTEIDNLIAQGHTILGGFICGGPHNDASMAGNGSDNIGVIVGSATYYNVPYSFYVFSQAYQTIRIKVCVLYI